MSSRAATRRAVPLAGHTTLRLGGPARQLTRADSAAEVVEAARTADAQAEPLLVLGGGSNVVIADAGVDGTALLVDSRGRSARSLPDGRVLLAVEAGEDWDEVVAGALADGLFGLECLSGIPGRTGAVPVQNVGAYGVEIAELLVDVDLYDRRAGLVREHVPAAELRLGYRSSGLKGRDAAIVLRVRLALSRRDGTPIRYPELARALDVPVGDRVDAGRVREAVLALRRSKGMVLDERDHDTWSVGSFFTNPLVPVADAARLGGDEVPRWPQPDGRVKLSAAWLISRAGFERGHPGPGGRVSLSTRHSLALTNRGTGTTEDLLALAREVRDGVRAAFGVSLTPEPVLVGCRL
jgi:UDP-N-acetylmuramate dehydrogenase